MNWPSFHIDGGVWGILFLLAIIGLIILVIRKRWPQMALARANAPVPTGYSATGVSAPAETTPPIRVVERTVVKRESVGGGINWGRIIGITLAVMLLLWLIFGGLGEKLWRDFVALGDGVRSTASAVSSRPGEIVPAVPQPGSVKIPAAGSSRSDVVRIRAGYTICRDAKLGSGSYDTEYQDLSGSEKWLPAPASGSYFARAEKYVSRTRAQELNYWFVRESSSC